MAMPFHGDNELRARLTTPLPLSQVGEKRSRALLPQTCAEFLFGHTLLTSTTKPFLTASLRTQTDPSFVSMLVRRIVAKTLAVIMSCMGDVGASIKTP
jgi:hypothetical protein